MQYYHRAASLAHKADNLSAKFARSVTPSNVTALRALVAEFEQFHRDIATDTGIKRKYDAYDPENWMPNLIGRHVERLRMALHDAELDIDPRNYRRVNAIRLVLVSAFVDTLDIVPQLRHYGGK